MVYLGNGRKFDNIVQAGEWFCCRVGDEGSYTCPMREQTGFSRPYRTLQRAFCCEWVTEHEADAEKLMKAALIQS